MFQTCWGVIMDRTSSAVILISDNNGCELTERCHSFHPFGLLPVCIWATSLSLSLWLGLSKSPKSLTQIPEDHAGTVCFSATWPPAAVEWSHLHEWDGWLHPIEAPSSLPSSVPDAGLTCGVVVPRQKSRTSQGHAARLVAPVQGSCARRAQSPWPNRPGSEETPPQGSQWRQCGALGEGLALEMMQLVGLQSVSRWL